MTKQYRVVFFIYNCYVCLNENKLIKFFDMAPSKLSDSPVSVLFF